MAISFVAVIFFLSFRKDGVPRSFVACHDVLSLLSLSPSIYLGIERIPDLLLVLVAVVGGGEQGGG
jgi:hypothetical protein